MTEDKDKIRVRPSAAKGLKGGKGVFGTPTAGNYGGVLQREKPASAKVVSTRQQAQRRAMDNPDVNKQYPGYYMSNPTNTPNRQSITVAQRMDMRSKQLLGEYARKRSTSQVAAATPPKPTVKPSRKPTEITIPGGGLKSAKVAPASSSSKSKPMATNRFTGSTLGFTSGKTTGSTVTKSGVAGKTTAASRAATRALDKGAVGGPRKDSSGRNASSMTGNRNSGRNLSGKP